MDADSRQANRSIRKRSIGFSASLIFIATLISRVSGFAREIVMAIFFATSSSTDAWLMASALPNLLFSTVNGAISVTLVPILTDGDASYSPRSVTRFLNEVFTLVVLVTLGLVAVGEVFAPAIVHLMAPGFVGHPGELTKTIDMTRIMLPTILFWGIAGLVVGALQERDEYFAPAMSPVAVNVVRIFTIILIGHYLMHNNIIGVAIGFTIAVAAQLVVTVPVLRRMGIHLRFRWHFSHPLLKRMIRMAGPFFLTSSVGSIGVIVDRILASELVVGSIAALNYAYVLVQIPVGLLVSSLAQPIYTRLSRYHSFHEDQTFRQLAMQGFRLVLAVIVPITIWFLVLNVPILRLLYQHGRFQGRSTDLTSGALFYFALGLPGFSLYFYLQRLFFATKDTRSPSRFSIITIIVNIIGDLILVRVMKVDGLALATGLAAWVNAILLAWKALKPRYNSNLHMGRTLLTLALAGLGMLGVSLASFHLLHLATMTGILPLFLALALTGIVSGAVYILLLLVFHYPDMGYIISRLTRGRVTLRR
nr:murein biosynthesis integral membrane protein MurJ [Sulfobacillus harzensis]